MRRTKIVCTIGPATPTLESVEALAAVGMNVARFNLSHEGTETHLSRIEMVRHAARATGRTIGILLDIQGPKIRIGRLQSSSILLSPGDRIALTSRPVIGNNQLISVGYPKLEADLVLGNTVFIDDGLFELRVEGSEEDAVVCRVIVGGELRPRKGVSLPGVAVDLPPLTETDKAHIRMGVSAGVEFIAASFVRRAAHVEAVREVLRGIGGDQAVIAKIESQEGVENVDEIIAAADGVMVARGDLGVEIPPEEVPLVQKMIIEKCNRAGKPVITATQMLESMVQHRRPTRAEVTDVASAIFDGTDAVMLSGETAMGAYPIDATRMMSVIAERIDRELAARSRAEPPGNPASIAEAICRATSQAAVDLRLAAIISSTQSGATARMVSKYRPPSPILAVTPHQSVARRLTLMWGVEPMVVPRAKNIDTMIDVAVKAACESGFVKSGDVVAITASVKTGTPGSTNLLQVHVV